jgi:membrane dipeptidase
MDLSARMTAITHAEALAHAHAILDKVPLIDAHNDLPIIIRHRAACDVRAFDLAKSHQGYDTDIARLKQGRLTAQWWAAFVPTRAAKPGLVTLEQIDVALQIAAVHPDVFLAATKASDVARAKRAGKIASFVTVENGVGLENSLAPLRIWYAAGVRRFAITRPSTGSIARRTRRGMAA